MIARNAVLNLVGFAAPLLVALFAIPVLIGALGVQRFGILALIWMVVGYFGVFDFGLSRALTQQLAARRAAQDYSSFPKLVWTGEVLLVGIGLLSAAALALLAPFLVTSIIAMPIQFQSEATSALEILALGVPISVATVGLRGVLEAYQRFDVVNAIRVFTGVLSFLGPIGALYVSDSLVLIAVVLVLARFFSLLWHLCVVLQYVSFNRSAISLRGDFIKPLLSTSGWMSVSTIINPLVGYLDRLVIGAALSLEAVTYYVTPNEVVTKLWVIPAALTGALFPEFAYQAVRDRSRLTFLYRQSVKWLFPIMYPMALGLCLFAEEFLEIWLGKTFSQNSSTVLQWFSVGILINCLAHVPFSVIQGMGRADSLAKLHLAELPFFVAALWIGASTAGIVGVAMAWSFRMVVDSALLFWLAQRLLGAELVPQRHVVALSVLVTVSLAISGALVEEITAKVVTFVAALLAVTWVFWVFILTSEDRSAAKRAMGMMPPA